jgi:HSP20 family protein
MSHSRVKPVGTVANLEKLELQRLKAKVERLVSALDEALEAEASDTYDSFLPSVDIFENSDMVSVLVELPGVPSSAIDLTVTAKEITIEGEKQHSSTTRKAVSHFCCERRYGRFHRKIILRWPVNINEVRAEMTGGVLHITLPKLVDRRGKSVRVAIETEEPTAT